MTEYSNENRGTLGKNKYYEEGGKKPAYKGRGNFDGKDFEISGWVQTNKTTGERFFSLSFQAPYVKPEVTEVQADESSDLPF